MSLSPMPDLAATRARSYMNAILRPGCPLPTPVCRRLRRLPQVLRAMTSCEAVAVAQRTTVVGAALGLTVYLASGGVGAGSSSSSSSGSSSAAGCGGAGGAGPVERSGGSGSGSGGGSGAELRALARAAVEALLEVRGFAAAVAAVVAAAGWVTSGYCCVCSGAGASAGRR